MLVCKLKGCEDLSDEELRVLADHCGGVKDVGVGCFRFVNEEAAGLFCKTMDNTKLTGRDPVRASLERSELFWNVRWWNYHCDWCGNIVIDLDHHINTDHPELCEPTTTLSSRPEGLLQHIDVQSQHTFNLNYEIASSFQEILNRSNEGRFTVSIFGSCGQHTASSNSDLDLFIRDAQLSEPTPSDQRTSLTEIYQLLTSFGGSDSPHGFDLILKAASPIISYTPSGKEGLPTVPCDFSLSDNGVKNTLLIREYIRQSALLRSLVFVSKTELRKLINPKIGMLSNYAVTLSVIRYCIDAGLVNHVDPSEFEKIPTTLQPPEYLIWVSPSPTDFNTHWKGFLRFMIQLSKGDTVVDIVDEARSEGWEPNHSNIRNAKSNFHCIQIRDPYEDRNLASGVGYVRAVFIKNFIQGLVQQYSRLPDGDEMLAKIQSGDEADNGENWYGVAVHFLDRKSDEAARYSAICATRLLSEINGLNGHKQRQISLLSDLLIRYSKVTNIDTSSAVLQYNPLSIPAILMKARVSPKLGRELLYHVACSEHIPIREWCEDRIVVVANLCLLLNDEEDVVHISGQALTRVALLVLCLKRYPMNHKLWKCLCWILSSDSPAVTVCGELLSPVEVAVRSLQLQVVDGKLMKSAAPDLMRLSEFLGSNEIELFGKKVNASSCTAAAKMMTL
eukprot:TRINITY_DN1724_c2_g1_i1.p1 TRINITY_DN1724_c2_g1~~TRINITY_DN1724_c2_g1_i1.p1  ORF type:complete len:674 (+),score=120.36 TRINITY_DN1724_c2_g1_i1:550-2571(+)